MTTSVLTSLVDAPSASIPTEFNVWTALIMAQYLISHTVR
jgi:hypothetical protein